jgi:hypothetical protein
MISVATGLPATPEPGEGGRAAWEEMFDEPMFRK